MLSHDQYFINNIECRKYEPEQKSYRKFIKLDPIGQHVNAIKKHEASTRGYLGEVIISASHLCIILGEFDVVSNSATSENKVKYIEWPHSNRNTFEE